MTNEPLAARQRSKGIPLMVQVSWEQREQFIAAFEAGRANDPQADLAAFLPPADHPLRREVLCELIRIDLEQRRPGDVAVSVESYLERFPELAADPAGLSAVAFEDYRQRCLAGERVQPEDYERRLGVAIESWPRRRPTDTPLPISDEDYLTNEIQPQLQEALDRSGLTYRRRLLERASNGVAAGAGGLPEAGDCFLGFELLSELGRGAFSRVFLAAQSDLAGRLVALKVALNLRSEPQVLARLQHTNIVPVYSVHSRGEVHAVCMPYFGATTVADLLRRTGSSAGPPASGHSIVQTLRDRKSETATGSAERPPAAQAPPPSAELLAAPVESTATLELLDRLSYVDAVLWLVARLADGLAHAHERGILHSDLKPANVLVTDEGQPMLLDFNLAVDTSHQIEARKAVAGGTLPYMAPEHLRTFNHSGSGAVDQRSDIYSLGVIFFELLACQHPFPARRGSLSELLPGMIAERQQAPRVRSYNRAVTPAVDAIVRRCLQPNPARRYQSARHLAEDLYLQRANRPLRHAGNPSVVERVAKWHRRHPRLMSVSTFAALAAVIAVVLAVALVAGSRSLARFEAVQTWQDFDGKARQAQLGVFYKVGEKAELQRGLADCRAALALYGVLDHADWQEQPAVANLPEEERAQVPGRVAELLLLLAHGNVIHAPGDEAAVREALRLNQQAEACYPEGDAPRAVWAQRAHFEGLLGHAAEAGRLQAKAEALPLQTTQELYWAAVDLYLENRHRDALPLLEQVVRRDPRHLRAWFVLGLAHYGLTHFGDAAHCFSTCLALDPDDFRVHYNRGLAHLKKGDGAAARADFTRVLELRPKLADAHLLRALALEKLKEYKAAVADVDRVLELEAPQPLPYMVRARLWEQLGEPARAKQDRAAGIDCVPTDEKNWVARGLLRKQADPKAAVADFDRALALNPRSAEALQNKAHVLADWMGAKTYEEYLDYTRQAVAVLDRSLQLHPDYLQARSGRGVLLARLGKRAEALTDAQEVLRREATPERLYEVACIYALTTRQQPADAAEAIRLLKLALRGGFGHDLLESDTDLVALRGIAEYRRLVEAVRTLRTAK
jgi:serine/threonine protein kinase/Tfp pilus assembly protein PilF